MKLSQLLLFSLFVQSSAAYGAACCGGGGASASALITGDDRLQFAASFSNSSIAVADVDAGGVWRTSDVRQDVRTLRLEGSALVSDRLQVGGAIPIVERAKLDRTSSGVGDLKGVLGYEYLPEWEYSEFRPKGIGFLQITVPTGKSRFESEEGGFDSRGSGFWAVGLGTILMKTHRRWDFATNAEIHRSFAKPIETTQVRGEMRPGFGGEFGIGGGYNWKDWRAGSSLAWTYEDAVAMSGTISNDGTLERYATFGVSLSAILSSEQTATIAYSDQTLFGSPINTSLARGLTFSYRRGWLR